MSGQAGESERGPRRRVPRLVAALAPLVLLAATACAPASEPAADGDDSEARASLPAAPGPAPDSEEPEAPPADRRYPVGTRNLVFEDTSRVTEARGPAPKVASRTLPTLVFYPAQGEAGSPEADPVADAPPALDDGPFPLVVFSHGNGGTGPAYTSLLRLWAASGYVVAAPTYPGSNAATPGGPRVQAVVHQPADVSFLIDQLSAPDAALAGLIDPERVGLAGHSLGGITSLGTAYHECCLDPEIDVVVEMAGLLYPFDGVHFGPEIDSPPLLIIHGTNDETVPYGAGEAIFDESTVPTDFVTLVDGDHIAPFLVGSASPQGEVVALSALDYFDAHLRDDRDALDELSARVADAGPNVATLERTPG